MLPGLWKTNAIMFLAKLSKHDQRFNFISSTVFEFLQFPPLTFRGKDCVFPWRKKCAM